MLLIGFHHSTFETPVNRGYLKKTFNSEKNPCFQPWAEFKRMMLIGLRGSQEMARELDINTNWLGC